MDHSESASDAVIAPTIDPADTASPVAPIDQPSSHAGQGTVQTAASGTASEAKKKRRRLPQGLGVGLFTGLVTSTLIAVYFTPTGQASLTAARHWFAKPTCANQQGLLQVPVSDVFANAYYDYWDTIPGYSVYHRPNYTIDGDLGTAWLQPWATSVKPSSYIEWAFNQRYDIRLICVVDGWTEDSKTYALTYPIGTATVYATNLGNPPPRIGRPLTSPLCPSLKATFRNYLLRNSFVKDPYQWQPVGFHCLTDNIVLFITGVAGEAVRNGKLIWGNPEPLTGLSEVRFYYCPSALCWLPAN